MSSLELMTEEKIVAEGLPDIYQYERVVGLGGLGTVYLVQNKVMASQPHFALKVMHTQFQQLAPMKALFQREAKIEQTLSHESFAKTRDFFQNDSCSAKLMVYYQGTTLKEAFQSSPDNSQIFSTERAVMILQSYIPLLKGVAYLHQSGLIHSDIKPGNLLLTPEFRLILLDFGGARVRPGFALDIEAEPPISSITPAYASLHQLKQLPPKPIDDCYALGCVLFEWLLGYHPYDRLAATEVKQYHLCPKLPKNVPSDLARLLMKAVSVDMSSGFLSAEAFMENLTSVIKGLQKKCAVAKLCKQNGPKHYIPLPCWAWQHLARLGW